VPFVDTLGHYFKIAVQSDFCHSVKIFNVVNFLSQLIC